MGELLTRLQRDTAAVAGLPELPPGLAEAEVNPYVLSTREVMGLHASLDRHVTAWSALESAVAEIETTLRDVAAPASLVSQISELRNEWLDLNSLPGAGAVALSLLRTLRTLEAAGVDTAAIQQGWDDAQRRAQRIPWPQRPALYGDLTDVSLLTAHAHLFALRAAVDATRDHQVELDRWQAQAQALLANAPDVAPGLAEAKPFRIVTDYTLSSAQNASSVPFHRHEQLLVAELEAEPDKDDEAGLFPAARPVQRAVDDGPSDAVCVR